jgi:hypothetical protein
MHRATRQQAQNNQKNHLFWRPTELPIFLCSWRLKRLGYLNPLKKFWLISKQWMNRKLHLAISEDTALPEDDQVRSCKTLSERCSQTGSTNLSRHKAKIAALKSQIVLAGYRLKLENTVWAKTKRFKQHCHQRQETNCVVRRPCNTPHTCQHRAHCQISGAHQDYGSKAGYSQAFFFHVIRKITSTCPLFLLWLFSLPDGHILELYYS